jgi:pyruvate,water dikinase
MPFATVRFEDVGIADVALVGGKNASLGEMVRALGTKGVHVPNGFAITAEGYRAFLAHNELEPVLRDLLAGPGMGEVLELQRRGHAARRLMLEGELPPRLRDAIAEEYAALGADVDVAVRSSATAEDLPEASFAGQQETYLAVHGIMAVLDAVRRCYASLFTDRAISYRAERSFDHLQVALSVGIQRMVRSDLASAGVIFTLDTESGFRDVVLVSGSWGLGETVVQGTVVPDEWLVFKPTLRTGHRPILRRVVGTKETKLVYDTGGGRRVLSVPVPARDRTHLVLTDDEVLSLAQQACIVEEHYSARLGRPCPMDLEWAKDGRTGELYIVQARPETVESRHAFASMERAVLDRTGPVLLEGRAVGHRIGSGHVRVVTDVTELGAFQDGDVLVSDRTDPDWEPVMRRAAAIVTNRGGRTCHAAIVSRELGLPAIVGATGATERLRTSDVVTVDCSAGEVGRVYQGKLPFHVEKLDATALPRPRTQIKVNVGNPEEALRIAALPNDGVGLARLEFIVASIGVHPMALLHLDRVDGATRAAIEARTDGASDKAAWFVDRLAEGVGTIAAAFHPKHVLVRFSDFKTNEYAHLLGGQAFEPKEENPMIGFRGAARYYDERYREAFALECRAMRAVRETMGIGNLHVMVPFCRTVEEGEKVLAVMREHGLEQGMNGLQVFVMCEVPSNVVLVAEFARIFDGFSIGSNDLTQLVLGVDRDAETLASLFDERNEAVRRMIAAAIAGAHAAGRPIGICGQAPSDHPEMAEWLVGQGIDSLSLSPDAVIATTQRVLDAERRAGISPSP